MKSKECNYSIAATVGLSDPIGNHYTSKIEGVVRGPVDEDQARNELSQEVAMDLKVGGRFVINFTTFEQTRRHCKGWKVVETDRRFR